jgi:hypothetical protein
VPITKPKARSEKGMRESMVRETVVEAMLERLGDLENYPEAHLAPYEEFEIGPKTYYFTPGGFLYRKDPGSDEVGGFFCGYVSDEVWKHRAEDG